LVSISFFGFFDKFWDSICQTPPKHFSWQIPIFEKTAAYGSLTFKTGNSYGRIIQSERRADDVDIWGIVLWNGVFKFFFGTDVRFGKVVLSTASSLLTLRKLFHEVLKTFTQTGGPLNRGTHPRRATILILIE
jgi:hypothetical protein